jgi:hypothetical protein
MATEIASASATLLPQLMTCFINWTKSTKYADGSIYTGQLDRFGNRVGMGTLRTPIYFYGAIEDENTASIVNWMEYKGEWADDKPSGEGAARRYRGDGTYTVLYNGIWANGCPVNDP